MKYKKCTWCNKELPATTKYFYRAGKYLNGMCKKCYKKYYKYYRRGRFDLLPRKQRGNIYALYKGEEILSIGTIKEISEELEVNPDTVRYYGTPAYKRRTSEENGRRLVKL